MDRLPGRVVLQFRKRDTAHLGAQRTGQRLDYHHASL